MRTCAAIVLFSVVLVGTATGREPWSIASSAEWTQATASANNVAVQDTLANGRSAPIPTLALKAAGEGQWTSKWHDWQGPVDAAEVRVEAAVDIFAKQNDRDRRQGIRCALHKRRRRSKRLVRPVHDRGHRQESLDHGLAVRHRPHLLGQERYNPSPDVDQRRKNLG